MKERRQWVKMIKRIIKLELENCFTWCDGWDVDTQCVESNLQTVETFDIWPSPPAFTWKRSINWWLISLATEKWGLKLAPLKNGTECWDMNLRFLVKPIPPMHCAQILVKAWEGKHYSLKGAPSLNCNLIQLKEYKPMQPEVNNKGAVNIANSWSVGGCTCCNYKKLFGELLKSKSKLTCKPFQRCPKYFEKLCQKMRSFINGARSFLHFGK